MSTTLTLRNRIEKVVDHFVASDEMFTLLDVSQAVKADGGDWVSHSHMRSHIEDVLRDCFSTKQVYAYYTESQIVVNTVVGSQTCRLFHPVGENPDNYIKRSQKASGPNAHKRSAQTATKKAPPGHPTVTGRKVIKGRSQQAQGYVEIPKAIWQKARFKPGHDAVLTIHNESITILHNVKSAKHYAKCQKLLGGTLKTQGIAIKVPKAGRFRISPNHLSQAHLDAAKLDFSAFTDKIVISKKF